MHALPRIKIIIVAAVLLFVGTFAAITYASHSWGSYHWARTSNQFTLKLGDNVSPLWDAHLAAASSDWSVSTVLDTTVVTGQSNPKNCRPILGKVQICNSKYGNNNWLGIASIWANGNHIIQGTVKLNDTHFNTPKYNTSAWRQFVMCQEIGHTFGLDHQDEILTNLNLGTCMDYTDDPDGTLKNQLSNKYPNQHDYDQLVAIYEHVDISTTTVSSKTNSAAEANINNDDINTSDHLEWGKIIRKSANGRSSLHERDLGKGNKLFTFVIWADQTDKK